MVLDTSGLLCHFDRAEGRHADAAAHSGSALFKLSHSYVLAEFVPLCETRGLPRVEALAFA